MEQGKDNLTNTTIIITNYSNNMNFLENDKLNDSTGTEFFDNEEKSVYQKISETPNFYHKSMTDTMHKIDRRKLMSRENSNMNLNLRKAIKFNENTINMKGTSLNMTRNGKIIFIIIF